MRKSSKYAAIAATLGLTVAGISVLSLYRAAQAVPPFYQEAVEIPLSDQEAARDAFVAQATALASDLNGRGRWQSLFTEEQINAWLALELTGHYPELLPAWLSEPRISINAQETTIACRYEYGDIAAVVSLSVDVYLHEPNVLALRIRKARAGFIPVPLAKLLEGITQAAQQLNLRLDWRRTEGDPVALIAVGPRQGAENDVRLDALELRRGELFLSGTIGPEGSVEPLPVDQPPTVTTVSAEEPIERVIGAVDDDEVIRK